MANLREGDNKIAITNSNNNQILEVLESEANKAYLDNDLDSNLAFDSDIKSNSDIEFKNKNDNNSISTSLQSLQNSINIATNVNNWFASINTPYSWEKLV